MFNDANRSGLVTANPFAALGLKQAQGPARPSLRVADRADVDRWLRIARGAFEDDYGEVFAAMIVFAAYTGLRPGELFALRLPTCAATRSRWLARPSRRPARSACRRTAGAGRRLPVEGPGGGRAMPVLEGQELVFVSPRGVQFWQNTLSWCWAPVRVAAGRPKMAFYELRHFCATHLLELGVPHADVAVQLGHTDGGALVMSTYGHPSERAARARILTALDGHETGDLAAFRDRRAG
jgi:integrase